MGRWPGGWCGGGDVWGLGPSGTRSAERRVSSGRPSGSCECRDPPLGQLCRVTPPPSPALLPHRGTRGQPHGGSPTLWSPHRGHPQKTFKPSACPEREERSRAWRTRGPALCSRKPCGRGTGRTRTWPFLSNYSKVPLSKEKTRQTALWGSGSRLFRSGAWPCPHQRGRRFGRTLLPLLTAGDGALGHWTLVTATRSPQEYEFKN